MILFLYMPKNKGDSPKKRQINLKNNHPTMIHLAIMIHKKMKLKIWIL